MPRRPRREEHARRKLARQYAREYVRSHPDETAEQVSAGVKAELLAEHPDKFGEGFDWVTFLPILIELIKTLLELFSDEE